MGDVNFSAAFSLVATALTTPLPLTWLSSMLVWVDQWPLKGEQLEQTCYLVKQQLEAGHIEPSISPWNIPVSVVPKKSGKWRLIHDLRKINESLQPYGLPTAGSPQSSLHSKALATFSYLPKELFLYNPCSRKGSGAFCIFPPSH